MRVSGLDSLALDLNSVLFLHIQKQKYQENLLFSMHHERIAV